MSIIRAAVGFVLANDKLGLSRLRSKFGERMALTPEWPMFDYVTEHDHHRERRVPRDRPRRSAASTGSNAFLASYRETYGEDAAPGPRPAL